VKIEVHPDGVPTARKVAATELGSREKLEARK
jgi:hypothetical protein